MREVLKTEPWLRQEEMIRAIDTHHRVAIRSGHKIGKSTSCAAIALWWISTRSDRAKVILTSSSYTQIEKILWPELRRLYDRANKTYKEFPGCPAFPIGGRLLGNPESGLKFADGRHVFGISTATPERMAGFSGAELLYIIDEASGIAECIFEAIEGNMAGGAKAIMFGNPTQTSGTFYEAFNGKAQFWHGIHISSEETPNAVSGEEIIPGLAGKDWIEEKRAEWGETSPIYAVRVRGDFPSQTSDAVISLELLESSWKRWLFTQESGLLHLGVDVARYGDDDTVIAPRRGLKALPMITARSMDCIEVAGTVLEAVRRLRIGQERPVVKVDVIGVGAGVYDQLRRSREVIAVPVNVAEASQLPEEYANLRAQVGFAVRDWMREGGTIPNDSKLHQELIASRYSFDGRARLKIESKDDIKKRLGRSPDRADALALSIFVPKVQVQHRDLGNTPSY